MPVPPLPYIVFGTITEDGSPKASATVTITNQTAGGNDTTTTDADGNYIYDDLAALPNGYSQGDIIKVSVPNAEATFAAAASPEEKQVNLSYSTVPPTYRRALRRR